MTDNNKKPLEEIMREFSVALNENMLHEENLSEDFWRGLSSEEQLWAFCAVVRRLVKGELTDRRSYRGVLYDIFNWGPEAYVTAQDAGFLDLHNSIYSKSAIEEYILSVVDKIEIENKEAVELAVKKALYDDVY